MKNESIMKYKLTYFLLSIFLTINLMGQTLVTINTQVSISHATIVSSVGGGVLVKSNGHLTNEGEFHIQGDFQNDGATAALDESTFIVKGDWINNVEFAASGGTVILDSSNQLITGDVPSNFYHLLLNGGIKTQTISAFSFSLGLEDTHLATNTSAFEIKSAATSALHTDGSWVSSDEGGQLIRATNSTGDYLYPVGSSPDEGRYRPVIVSPNSSSLNKVGVRMVNHNPTDDGFNIHEKDGAISEVNANYYHLIEHTEGISDFDLTFQYATGEIDAETVAHWNSSWKFQFNIAGGNDLGNITALNVSDFTSEAFALADMHNTVYLPNAFTPDNDGLNDYFSLSTDEYKDLTDFQVQIFNRWGETVFESTDPNFHWAGGKEFYPNSEVFAWQLKFKEEDTSDYQVLEGHLTIIR